MTRMSHVKCSKNVPFGLRAVHVFGWNISTYIDDDVVIYHDESDIVVMTKHDKSTHTARQSLWLHVYIVSHRGINIPLQHSRIEPAKIAAAI